LTFGDYRDRDFHMREGGKKWGGGGEVLGRLLTWEGRRKKEEKENPFLVRGKEKGSRNPSCFANETGCANHQQRGKGAAKTGHDRVSEEEEDEDSE